MNNFHLQKRLLIAAAGGLAGFFLTLLAVITVIVVALMSGTFVFGGGTPSPGGKFVVNVLVPLLICIGAAIPAWKVGTKWWYGLLAGIVAMIVFVFIELNGGGQVNYGIFSQRETIAYISAALVSAFSVTVGRNEFQSKGYVLMFVISVVATGLRFIVPEENFVVGFIASLLAWILLPLAVAFATDIKRENGAT